jgi:phenylpyruvate tautomerase
MPCLEVTTNVRVQDKNKLMRALSDYICTELCKAETYMMVMVKDETSMLFGGNDEPVAHISLRALNLKDELIRKLAGALTEMMHTELGIESQRVYIAFMDVDPGMWAWDGRTFA